MKQSSQQNESDDITLDDGTCRPEGVCLYQHSVRDPIALASNESSRRLQNNGKCLHCHRFFAALLLSMILVFASQGKSRCDAFRITTPAFLHLLPHSVSPWSRLMPPTKGDIFERNPRIAARTGLKRGETSMFLVGDATGPLVDAWQSYNEALVANPLMVKSITAGVILGAADLTGQALEKVRSAGAGGEDRIERAVDVARVARFAIFGLVLQAPWNHFYYQLLDGVLPPTPDPFTVTTAVKTAIDQFIQAPVFTVLIFVFLGALEGKNVDGITKQLRDSYGETIIANWKLWVPATVVNLAFVPPILRVLYLNIVFFFWSIYLSLVLNKSEDP
jgi:peroxisomal membrane protein 2